MWLYPLLLLIRTILQVLPGDDVIHAQIICDGAVVTGIDLRKACSSASVFS